MRKIILFIFIISTDSLSAQEYQVNLRLTSPSNFYRELHPKSDYQHYGIEAKLISELVALHGKGKIEIFGDFPERKAISPDSISEYFNLPHYSLLDSLMDWEEIYFKNEYKAWYPEGYENYSDFDEEIIVDSNLTEAYLDSIKASGDFDDFGPDEIIELDSTFRDSLTGRDQIRLFVEYQVYLEEIWKVTGSKFEISSNWIRIDLLGRNEKMYDLNSPNMPEQDETDQTEFPFSLIKGSLFIHAKDWVKLKPEWIFEKKWTARKGKKLPDLFIDRNFPTVVSSIFPKDGPSALFINHRKGHGWMDSLLKQISYKEFYDNKVNVANTAKLQGTEILENFKIELRDDTMGLHSEVTKEDLTLLEKNRAFLSSQAYQDILNLAFLDKIPRYYPSYMSGNSSTDEVCRCNYTSSLFLEGDLVRKNKKVSFSPKTLIVVVAEKKGNHFIRNQAFSLNLPDTFLSNIF